MSKARDKLHTVSGRLFQAAMWRRYAMDWDSCDPLRKAWIRNFFPYTRAQCLRRARINLYLAHRLNRRRFDG